MNNAIVVENLVKAYGSVKALNGVSLNAEAGRVLGLLGPNGAGKTTIVRILTTLLKPDAGQAFVAGVDVLRNPEHARHVFGLAGQYPAVDPQLTGQENLEMVGRLYHFSGKEAKARARELLARFTLEDAADRPVKTYSGGMRRRLDLAAAIVARPPVLFLDEPTTGLDPRTRKDLWEFIRELVRDGTTLLLTTQYLEEADELTDRIVLIDEGMVKAEGTPAELKSRFSSDVLEMRLENEAQAAQALDILRTVNGHQPTLADDHGLIRLPVDHGAQSLLKAVRALDDAQIVLADVALRQPTLDDVFLSLTQKSGQPA